MKRSKVKHGGKLAPMPFGELLGLSSDEGPGKLGKGPARRMQP